MLRNARFIVGLCALAGIFITGVIAWSTGLFSRITVGVADVWGRLLDSIDGLSTSGLLAAFGAGAAMLLIAIIAITDH